MGRLSTTGNSRTRSRLANLPSGGAYANVAAWVAANSSKVISYYPLDDCVANGTMNDALGSIDGTYGSVVTTGTTIQGIPAANWSNITAAGQTSFIPDDAAFDSMKGVFAVVEFSSLSNVNLLLQRRSPSDSTSDRFQWFTNTSANEYRITNFGTPDVGVTPSPFSTSPATYTVGAGYDGTTLSLYVNGVAVASNSSGNPFPASSGNRIDVGSGTVYSPNQELDGAMCELVFLSNAASTVFAELHAAWLEEI